MSVAMTGISTVVGVLMLPLNLYIYCMLLYGKSMFKSSELTSLAVSLSIVLVALCVGLAASWKLQSERARRCFNVLGNCFGVTLLIVSLFVNASQSKVKVWETPLRVHAAVATPIVLTIVLTIGVSSILAFKLQKAERCAVVIEACYQNPSLATSIVLGMFAGTDAGDAVSVPLLYGGYEAVLLGLFCLGAYFCNWTLVNPNEVGLMSAIKGNFQHLSKVEDLEPPFFSPETSLPSSLTEGAPAEPAKDDG